MQVPGQTEDHNIACLRPAIAAARSIDGFEAPELETAEAMLRQRTGAASLDVSAHATDPCGTAGSTMDRSVRRRLHTGPEEEEALLHRGADGRVSFDNVQDPFSRTSGIHEARRRASLDSVRSEPKGPLAPRTTRGGKAPPAPPTAVPGSPGSVAAISSFDDNTPPDSPGAKAKSWSWKRTPSKDKSKSPVYKEPGPREGTSI